MLRIQQYVKAQSLEEAYTLLTKNRNNQILGGMCWLKMEDRLIPCAIDLGDLGLDKIEESEDVFTIGAMTTLRTLETHASLNAWCDYIIRDSVKDIVGVQLRNLATLGGSLYSRFGFSDVLTAFLCLDCDVVLYHGGVIPLAKFVQMPYMRDIITHVIVHKNKERKAFACVRKSATDLSLLNISASTYEKGYVICVGARPYKAVRFEIEKLAVEEVCQVVSEQVELDDNMRASKEYRRKLVGALCRRVLEQLEGKVCK